MHASTNVHLTRELTGLACSRLWKFATWRFVHRRLTVFLYPLESEFNGDFFRQRGYWQAGCSTHLKRTCIWGACTLAAAVWKTTFWRSVNELPGGETTGRGRLNHLFCLDLRPQMWVRLSYTFQSCSSWPGPEELGERNHWFYNPLIIHYLVGLFKISHLLPILEVLQATVIQKNYLFIWLWRVLAHGIFHWGTQAPEGGLSSCGSWAYLLQGMWDLTSPTRIESMIPAVPGVFLTAGPPGKSWLQWFKKKKIYVCMLKEPEWVPSNLRQF